MNAVPERRKVFWYLTLYFLDTNKVFVIGEGTKTQMIDKMRQLAHEFTHEDWLIVEDLSLSYTGYPQMTLQTGSKGMVQLQVCDERAD